MGKAPDPKSYPRELSDSPNTTVRLGDAQKVGVERGHDDAVLSLSDDPVDQLARRGGMFGGAHDGGTRTVESLLFVLQKMILSRNENDSRAVPRLFCPWCVHVSTPRKKPSGRYRKQQ